jgi:hypothetical protein
VRALNLNNAATNANWNIGSAVTLSVICDRVNNYEPKAILNPTPLTVETPFIRY